VGRIRLRTRKPWWIASVNVCSSDD